MAPCHVPGGSRTTSCPRTSSTCFPGSDIRSTSAAVNTGAVLTPRNIVLKLESIHQRHVNARLEVGDRWSAVASGAAPTHLFCLNPRRLPMPLRRHALAVALTVPSLALGQSATITIRAGTVLDGRGGVARNTTIVIAGSRIVGLDPALTTATYDLVGLTVMPGGIDTHVHLTSHFDANGRAHNDPGGSEPLEQTVLYTEENAYRALMAGITTVQSIGSTLGRDRRDAIARGTIPGPRVITSLDWITPEAGDADGLRRAARPRRASGHRLRGCSWTALRRACACRRGGAARRAGGGHVDRARRAARRGDARSDGGARHVLRPEPLPRQIGRAHV